jgi:hypothetical protein
VTHRERAGEITRWLDAQARLRGIRLPADVRRDLVDAVEEQMDEAVSAYANAREAGDG